MKARNVASATFEPWAECVGTDGLTPCPGKWNWASNPRARQLAREHAEAFPGHRVRVVTEKVDLYQADPS